MTPEILCRNPKIAGAGLSVIIPSKNAANLMPCLAAVHLHNPGVRVIVVDDGIDFNEWECRGLIIDDLARRNVALVEGAKPFVFARNMNIGIGLAGDDDVVLLNDDAILQSPSGFRIMQRAAEQTAKIGLVSATTNVAGNPEQHRRIDKGVAGITLRIAGVCPGNSFPSVAFVCVLIPRRTIGLLNMQEKLLSETRRTIGPGPLDERFTAYGWEDNDLCRRVQMVGLRIGIHDGCYVDHGSLQSTFRGGAYAAGDIHAGRKIYIAKWGSM